MEVLTVLCGNANSGTVIADLGVKSHVYQVKPNLSAKLEKDFRKGLSYGVVEMTQTAKHMTETQLCPKAMIFSLSY